MNALQELIEKLEKATAPDRELDFDIAMYLNRPFGAWESFQKYDAAFPAYTRRDAPAYTSSIDAALTLVPGIYAIDVTQFVGGIGAASLWQEANSVRGLRGERYANPAIALCIAALRARATKGREE